MNDNEKALARTLFENKIHKKSGTEFEAFFTLIMSYAYKDFRQVKPQGRIGDRKNDGYIPSTGTYYQVYAPENPSSDKTPAKVVKKAKDDFDGLLKDWSKICEPRKYYFVFNDKYYGSYPEIEETMSEIQRKHDLAKCNVFLAKDLEDVCFSLLDDSQLIRVVGFIPSADQIDLIDYTILSKVIGYVMSKFKPIEIENWDVPEFDGKISFNNLSDPIKSILNNAFYQYGILEEYFKNKSDFVRQEIRDRISKAYKDSVDEFISIDIENKSDHVFMEIAERITPNNVSNNKKSVQDAVFVLMAYYFSSCDIFESPSEQES